MRDWTFEQLQEHMHRKSADGGWWDDLTPANETFFIATKLGLIMSEAAEAFSGYRTGTKDKHLPHRDELEVELADLVIRAMDLAEFMGYDLVGTMQEKDEYNARRADFKVARTGAAGSKKF
ncbi:pyrophosphatase [Paracoccus phage ParKuw1]|uniref:Pyrophosphatase n=1 Tax=Paracoccus phage ParKuw1 TaxID=3032415 RepID=A0AAF0FD68_9CAUD|nr:pyrophosphatase [Paracoccus phage ParKuw1]